MAEYARTSVNRFCADGRAQSVHSHPQDSLLLLLQVPTGLTARYRQGLRLISISRTRKDMAVEEPKGGGAFALILCACSNSF
jgi:hypothetical protein